MLGILLLAAALAPQLPTVFGLQLGAPITLPECKHKVIGDQTFSTYEDQPAETCQAPSIQLSDAPFQRGDVNFPRGQAPDFIVPSGVSTYFLGGPNLIAVEASTTSYGNAGVIVAELTAKFGKPSSDRVHQQIVDQVPVPSRHVVWEKPGYTVDYEAISSADVGYGELMITTDAYNVAEAKEAAARDAKRTPL